jgi:hypothetical protein
MNIPAYMCACVYDVFDQFDMDGGGSMDASEVCMHVYEYTCIHVYMHICIHDRTSNLIMTDVNQKNIHSSNYTDRTSNLVL